MAAAEKERWNALSITTLRKFTDKRSTIYFANKSKKVGWIHAIDPVTRTVVLEEENEGSKCDAMKLTFVSGHTISHVVLEQDGFSGETPRHEITEFIGCDKSIEYSEDELAKRRAELMEWLTLNRVPVSSECSEGHQVLSVMGVLFVEPPYGPESCRCSNEIILDRIQKLIRAKQDHVLRS